MNKLQKLLFFLLMLVILGVAVYSQGFVKSYREYCKAESVFRRAQHGNPRAQNKLGQMYLRGEGVPRNNYEAIKWFRMAANQKFSKAQFNLGIIYYEGQGVPRDYVLAYLWFNLGSFNATGKDNEATTKHLEKLNEKMTPEQIAKAKHLLLEWKTNGTND